MRRSQLRPRPDHDGVGILSNFVIGPRLLTHPLLRANEQLPARHQFVALAKGAEPEVVGLRVRAIRRVLYWPATRKNTSFPTLPPHRQ